jgi:formylglycine-generating enzyme required for sulfatase activity
VEVIEMNPFAHLSDFVDRLNKVDDFRLPNPLSFEVGRFGSIKYEMVKVPIPDDDYNGAGDQQIWIGIYPVTNREYRVFCKNTGHPEPEYWSKQSINENQPVVKISYVDVEKFCKWVGLELPTQEQWKYFACAGSSERYWWGSDDSLLSQVAWYKDNSEDHPHPVGTKRPNTWGIYDVFGNVWEWTLKYTTEVAPRYSDIEVTAYRAKVCGGAYNTELKHLHTSEERLLNDMSLDIGFRCIRIESIPIGND